MALSDDAGSVAGIGLSAASGNWLGAAIGAIGLGAQLFGGLDSAKVGKEQAAVSADEAKQEQGINDAKQQAMELSGRRTQMEDIRNTQRARAMSLNTATNQGAQFGTGLQGGLDQIMDQGLFNLSGVNSALQTGREINTFNSAISADKIRMAQLGGQSATDQGIASLGGALIKAGPVIGQFSQGFGGSSPTGNNYGYTSNGPNAYGNGKN